MNMMLYIYSQVKRYIQHIKHKEKHQEFFSGDTVGLCNSVLYLVGPKFEWKYLIHFFYITLFQVVFRIGEFH